MDFTEYQTKAHSMSINTEILGDRKLYPVLGLCGESGEIAEKFKKLYRDNNGEMSAEFKRATVKELGDVLWYLAEICSQMEINLTTVAETNIEKLSSRKERGLIQGDGDNR